ncbi:cellulase family glycosylhydrolase [Cellulomonas humilata]|uniref:cellulase n=1 Tax=Cellulomonas humilata TaxID=144055 RepID=A0A7Y6A139_9CELL|nr:cellulase family glycosylhydrolase [Cellulomonas humilata]
MSSTHRLRVLATSVAATAALTAPLVLGAVPAQAAAGDDWLHVSGNKIVDEAGKEVWLTGTNWFGFNASERVFHGLWSANITTLTKGMADRGINTVRVPISTQLLLEWRAGTFLKPNVNTYANPELEGLNSLQIFDYWLTLCERYGIKVFLDVHSAEADNAGHVYPVWWKGAITTDDVYAGWEWVAERYKNNDTIIGADVKNEPHGAQGATERAKWDGSTDKDNFKHFAQTAGRKILAINPHWLIFVEGIEVYPKPGVPWTSTGLTDYYGTWWGGNLRGVKDFPIDLGANQDQLVYSPHDYGPLVFDQPWFQGTWDRTTLERDVWDPNWLYLHKQNVSPLLIGEWGGFLDGGRNEKWMNAIRDLIVDRRLSHTFWVLNPNSGDTGGLLNYDWTTWDEAKYALLKPSLWQDGGKFVSLDHTVRLGGAGSTTGKSLSEVGGQPGDTTAPTVPTNLAAGTPSTTTVPLTWSPSTDAGSGVAGYEVYRGTTLVGTPTTSALTVTGLAADTPYSFTVRAKDVAGNVSASSVAVTARTAVGGSHRHGGTHRPDGPRSRHRHHHHDPAALDGLHRQRGGDRLRRLPGGHAGGQQHDPELDRDRPVPRDLLRVHGRGEGRGRQPFGGVHRADGVHRARRGHRLVRRHLRGEQLELRVHRLDPDHEHRDDRPVGVDARVRVRRRPDRDAGLERDVQPDRADGHGDGAGVELDARARGEHRDRVQRLAHRHQHRSDRVHRERRGLRGAMTS